MGMPNALNALSSSAAPRLKRGKGGGVANKLPHQVLRRNERERKRVQQVNLGFIHLRDRVPHSATSKKLSKVETLREAARYIKHLQDLLQGTCDKPFEPLAATGESNNGSGMPASRENCCPAQQVPPIQTEYPFTVPNVESLPSQLYYQHYTANTAYYKPSACYLSCPVKSEIPSPSPSESSVELARYSHRNYAL